MERKGDIPCYDCIKIGCGRRLQPFISMKVGEESTRKIIDFCTSVPQKFVDKDAYDMRYGLFVSSSGSDEEFWMKQKIFCPKCVRPHGQRVRLSFEKMVDDFPVFLCYSCKRPFEDSPPREWIYFRKILPRDFEWNSLIKK